ncbi:MAG: type II secretion system F family protein [Leptospirillum sp.]
MWLLALPVAALLGLGVYQLTTPVSKIRFRSPPAATKPVRERGKVGSKEADSGLELILWLSGIKLPARLVRPLQIIFGGVIFFVSLLLTHDVVIAAIVGLYGFTIPMTALRNLAVSRWWAADGQAYVLANTMSFSLPVYGHPLTVLRDVSVELDDPLRSWILEALAMEAAGIPIEQSLAELGVRLHHSELQLFAEIIRADRHEKPSAELLGRLVEAWTDRVRFDQQRRAKLSGGKRLSNILIGGPVIFFLLLPLIAPGTAAAFYTSLGGQLVAVAGMLAMATATVVARRALSKAEGVMF